MIYDGCSSHISDQIIDKAIKLMIRLIFLPPNATHLIQPLDIAVFKTFKLILRRETEKFIMENGTLSLSKKEAIYISSKAWKEAIVEKPRNIVSGFKTSGLFPPSLPSMQKRLKLFEDGGVDDKRIQQESWVKIRKVVRNEILFLPKKIKTTPKRRKTIDVNDRISTKENILNFD